MAVVYMRCHDLQEFHSFAVEVTYRKQFDALLAGNASAVQSCFQSFQLLGRWKSVFNSVIQCIDFGIGIQATVVMFFV